MDKGITELKEHRPSKDAETETTMPKRSPNKRHHILGRDPGKIRRLKCFAEVDRMIREGVFLRDVEDYIRSQGEMEGVSRAAIRSMIRRHKKYVFSDDSVLDGDLNTNEVDEDDPFYALYSLERKLRQMERRIDMEVQTEENLSKLFSTTHKEFLTHFRLAKGILDRRDKLGLLKKERGGTRQRVGSGTSGRVDVQDVISKPESRHKVLGLVEALMRDPELLDHIGDDKKDVQKVKTPRPKRRKRRKKNDN